jgi:hypothetical protein
MRRKAETVALLEILDDEIYSLTLARVRAQNKNNQLDRLLLEREEPSERPSRGARPPKGAEDDEHAQERSEKKPDYARLVKLLSPLPAVASVFFENVITNPQWDKIETLKYFLQTDSPGGK